MANKPPVLASFFMPMRPPTATAQEKGVNTTGDKPHFYDKPRTGDAKAKLEAHLAPYAPKAPYEGPIRLIAKWCYPVAGKHHDGEYKTTRPDTDNAQKLLKDAMTRLGYWKDDAQVASEVAEKFWADKPGIYIRIESLP